VADGVSDYRFDGNHQGLSSAMNLFRIGTTVPDLLRFPFCYFQGADPDLGSSLPVSLQHQADTLRPGIAEYLPEHCYNIFHRVDVIVVQHHRIERVSMGSCLRFSMWYGGR